MSEPVDLDGIEARANAATPGPWAVDYHSVAAGEHWVAHIPGYDPGEGAGNPRDDADAAHIAGMDPATTLALVAEVRALREDAALHHEGYEHDRAEIARLEGALADAWEEGHRTRWRRGPDNCFCHAHSSSECGCGEYGTGELLSLRDNPYRQDAP